MTIKKYIFIPILIVLTNCHQGNDNEKIKLNGTWTYEGVLTPQKQLKMIKGGHQYFFDDDGTFKRTSIGYDVMTEMKGNYTVIDSSETKSSPLLVLFRPITLSQAGDTISSFIHTKLLN